MKPAFFFSFTPRAQVIDPNLPIPSWNFFTGFRNMGELGEDADGPNTVLILDSFYTSDGY